MVADGRMPYSGMQAPNTTVGQNRRKWNPQPQPQGNFPAPQQAPPNFMPYMPSYEAGLRGIEDPYAAQQQALSNQWNLIAPQVNMQTARLGTDKTYATNAHKEAMTERGIWDSTINPYLYQRNVEIPYGRQEQDLGIAAQSAYGDLTNQLIQNALAYNQGYNELILNNAAEAASEMPYNVPQYSSGPRLDSSPGITKKKPRRKPKGKKGGKK